MPLEVVAADTAGIFSFWIFPRVAILLLASLYFIFSLIVARQVNLMFESVLVETAPILKAFAIIHTGLALGIIILFIGFLFG